MGGHKDRLCLLQLQYGLLLEGVELEGPTEGHLRNLLVEVRERGLGVQHLRPPRHGGLAGLVSLRDGQDLDIRLQLVNIQTIIFLGDGRGDRRVRDFLRLSLSFVSEEIKHRVLLVEKIRQVEDI